MGIDLYVIRNKEGKYFRAKGYGGSGPTWVDDVNKCKVYTKLGQARARVTWFTREWPDHGIPDILKLIVTSAQVLDESARVKKAVTKLEEEKIAREKRDAKQALEAAQRDFDSADARLRRLRRL